MRSESAGLPALSLLDLAFVRRGQKVGEAIAESTELAQKADELGRFARLWFAEHHNMPSIASAATSVLLAHIAANTATIRLGSGGVMLPNHSPLVIAEQFGTLAELHPGRIDLGLGRAPGTDQLTSRALRVSSQAADQFPQDVRELQGYLGDQSPVPGINAFQARGRTSRSISWAAHCLARGWPRSSDYLMRSRATLPPTRCAKQ